MCYQPADRTAGLLLPDDELRSLAEAAGGGGGRRWRGSVVISASATTFATASLTAGCSSQSVVPGDCDTDESAPCSQSVSNASLATCLGGVGVDAKEGKSAFILYIFFFPGPVRVTS